MGKLTGKSVCLTGKMTHKRSDLEQMAAEAGAEVRGSVNKTLDFLVIADPENSMSSKAINARKFGTTLISEEQLLEMIA